MGFTAAALFQRSPVDTPKKQNKTLSATHLFYLSHLHFLIHATAEIA